MTRRVVIDPVRLWPPGWIFTRVATADTELGGHVIPSGTAIVYSPYLVYHRPDLYPEIRPAATVKPHKLRMRATARTTTQPTPHSPESDGPSPPIPTR